MIDAVFVEINLPTDGADWESAMRQRAITVRKVMAATPGRPD